MPFRSRAKATRGLFRIVVKNGHWLRRVVSINASSGDVTLDILLANGDVNGDNTVSLADLVPLRAAYGSTLGSANWNANADLNCDGQVSVADLVVLRRRLGSHGD